VPFSLTAGLRQQRQESIERPLAWLSPLRVLPLMAVSIFCAEVLVMILLARLPELSTAHEAVLDAGMLLLLLSPTFYLFHYRPLRAHYHERKAIIDQLLESEERLDLALGAVNDGLWDWNIATDFIYFSPRGQAILGYAPDQLEPHLKTWENLIHPEDRQAALQGLRQHLAGETDSWVSEHRLLARDGRWVWVLARGRVVEKDAGGRPQRAVGTYTDITARKQAEELLRLREEDIRLLSRQLMHSSEAERKQVAQDLHDEFGQVLTAFQFGIEMLRNHSFRDEEDYQEQCARLLKLSGRLQKDIRSICDRLRPVMLDDIGLAGTLQWLVDQIAMQSPEISYNFTSGELQGRPSPESEMVLYRICQEALTNILKHARASHVEIRLAPEGAELVLRVKDNGEGFLPHAHFKGRRGGDGQWGFGLLGMNERVAAVNGRVLVDSSPGLGTLIEARIPIQCRGSDEQDPHLDRR